MAKKKNLVARTKSNLTLLLVAIIAVGWILTLSTIMSEDVVSAQNEMIEAARKYAEDGLYVKAARQYLSALGAYKTENNFKYQTELLDVYRSAEMTDEYYSLIDSRISEGTAPAEEYIERAQQYTDRGSESSAINVLKSGLEKYADNTEIRDFYESLSYINTYTSSTCAELSVPNSDWYVPAFDGEKWGYINVKGKTVLDFVYDEAMPFSGSYAVVKLDGQYITVDKNGRKNSIDKIGLDSVKSMVGNRIVGIKDGRCGIYNIDFKLLSGDESYEDAVLSDNGIIAVRKNGKWALIGSDLKAITDYIFTDIAVNSRGQLFNGSRAVAADEKGYFLINNEGKAYYDNIRFADAKGFEGGYYAVSDGSGKWGFAGLKGELILDYQYDDARSFSNRLAAVKIGDVWGYVNMYGTVQIEPQFTDANIFIEGSALAKSADGTYKILTLKYYSLF